VSLGKCDPSNKEAIAALTDLLSSPDTNERIHFDVVKSLGEIWHGNKEVIAALTDLLSSPDKFIRRDAAVSLGKCDPSNKEAITALTDLLSSPDKFIRRGFVDSLGKIGRGNKEAIAALIELLSSPNKNTCREVAMSLGQIGQDNPEAITALINLLSSPDTDRDTRRRAAESLEKILQKEQMLAIVTTLKDYLSYDYVKILWKCAQTLSYPAFYQAWDHPPITPHPEVLDTTAIGSTALTQTLNLQLLANELPAHCLYLDAQPLNAYTLPELSQEICNLIHKHLNQYPIPEANNLPQLKRHLLPLLAQHPQLTLIFGHAYPSDTLLTFCQQLNATIAIAWINNQAIPNLQTFSSQDPNLLEKILNWLNNAIGEQ